MSKGQNDNTDSKKKDSAGIVKKLVSYFEKKIKDGNKSSYEEISDNPHDKNSNLQIVEKKNEIGGDPEIAELPKNPKSTPGNTIKKTEAAQPLQKNFSVTYENGIIKFKIKSGPEDSGEKPAKSSGGVSKFDYNKKPDSKDLENLKNESNDYLLNTYTKENEKTKILELLKKASEATIKEFQGKNLDKNFFIAVMKVASEKLGIASNSEEEFNKCFNEALKEIDPNLDLTKYNPQEGNTLHKIAKFFSAKFQKFSQGNNYCTPRTDSNVGRRLFRVCTEENIDAFQKMQIKEIEQKRGEGEDLPSESPHSISKNSIFRPASSSSSKSLTN